MPLSRNFEADYRLITGQDQPGAPGALAAGGSASPAGPPGAGLPVQGSAVQYGGGGAAQRIATIARGLLGTPNQTYFSQDRNNACASFVSTVLLRAGAVPGREQVVAQGFTRAAAGLTHTTEDAGAVPVFPGREARLNAANIAMLQPGDVLQFRNDSDRFDHSAVCIAPGRLAGTSSRHQVIADESILSLASEFGTFQAHRFTK